MKPADILSTAASLVSGERNRQHGSIREHYDALALMWTAVLTAAGKAPDTPLDAHDAANMMEVLKITRRYFGAINEDDYVDGAGYSAIAGFLRTER